MRRELPLPSAAAPAGSRPVGNSGPSLRASETSTRDEASQLMGIRDTPTLHFTGRGGRELVFNRAGRWRGLWMKGT